MLQRKTICTHSPENWSFQLLLTTGYRKRFYTINPFKLTSSSRYETECQLSYNKQCTAKKYLTFPGRTALGCARRQKGLPGGRAVWCALLIKHLRGLGSVLTPSWGTSHTPSSSTIGKKNPNPLAEVDWDATNCTGALVQCWHKKANANLGHVDVVHQTQKWQFKKWGSAEINKTDKQSIWGESIEQ